MRFTFTFIFLLFSQFTLLSQKDDAFYKTTDFSYLRDTVYTLKPYFIEVNLKTQKGYLYSRDSVKEFGLSSGTKRLEDGVDTKEGLFVIQSKMPKWYSQQFDSTVMLNWMGFNYGIGFHALLGSGYYRYLGKKRSSHGCIRISRAMASELYSKISLGTPVIVHSNNNAVWVSFIDSTVKFSYYKSNVLIKKLKERYRGTYAGNFFNINMEPMIIDDTNVSHNGLPLGDRKRIPKRQILKPFYKYISVAIPEPKPAMPVEKELDKKFEIVQMKKEQTGS